MFGEITSRNVYLIQNYEHSIDLMSDLLNVEKSLRWETHLYLHKKCICFLTVSVC